ncbi:MAG: hypothetical protein COY40_04845 [Alphaproteobacteria bacterium CG_4_10_14_0_8_um_filter_53_9]|nr:MAG: hypothetical protein COY40_04845 [Alphaproteobacteria bacterium CG_4_10_14_0_8_um_filter_53_9]
MKTKRPFHQKKLKAALQKVALVLIVFALVIAVVLKLLGTSLAPLAILPLNIWASLAGAIILSNLLRMQRYVVFTHALGLKVPIGVLNLFVMAGTALIATPGKVGTALRLWLLHKAYKIPYRRSTPMLFMDMLTDFIAMLMLTLLGMISLGNMAGLAFALLLFSGLLVGVLMIFVAPRLTKRLIKIGYACIGKKKPKLFAALLRLVHRLRHMVTLPHLGLSVGLAVLGWVILAWGLSHLAQGMGLSLSLAHVLVVLCAGTMLGALTFLPGGLGGAEATMLALLTLFGVPLPQAVLFTLTLRLSTLWIPTFMGLFCLPVALHTAKKASSPKGA